MFYHYMMALSNVLGFLVQRSMRILSTFTLYKLNLLVYYIVSINDKSINIIKFNKKKF